MKSVIRYLTGFVAAVVTTGVLGSIASTQFVIAALADINVDVPFLTRLSMTLNDMGILAFFLPAVGACFFVGFLVAGLCSWKIGGSRTAWFVVAGASALLTELFIIENALGLMPISGARTMAGMMSQGVAAAVGGWVFAAVTRSRGSEAQHA